jgi:hypothetical protein
MAMSISCIQQKPLTVIDGIVIERSALLYLFSQGLNCIAIPMRYTIHSRTLQKQEKLQKVHCEVQSQTPTSMSPRSHVHRSLSSDGEQRIQLVTKRDNPRRMFQLQKKREVFKHAFRSALVSR